MIPAAPRFAHDPAAAGDAYALGGPLAWAPAADHLPALAALAHAPDGDCASCALKCCAYVISVPAPEIPGLVLAAARLGLTASTLFRPPSPDDEPHARSLARRDDGRCLFLDPAGACRVHATSGPAAKPTVCQLFPGQPLVTPDGRARLGVRPECPWPRVSAAPDAVARHQAALASRAAGPPGLSVRTVPAVIPLAGPATAPFAPFDAWLGAAAAAIATAPSALAGLDAAVTTLLADFALPRPAADPHAARVLAAALSGVLEAQGAPGAAQAFFALATGAPPADPRKTPPLLVAAALGSFELLRFPTALGGLGALRLFAAACDRDPRADVAPREAFAGLFRQLAQPLVRLPLARATAATLEALAVDPTL